MKNKKTAFEETTEIVGWIQIFLSPFIISLVLALIIYLSSDTVLSQILALAIIVIGIIVGIKLANKKYNSEDGTMHYLSQTDATPEIDKKIDADEIKKE